MYWQICVCVGGGGVGGEGRQDGGIRYKFARTLNIASIFARILN